MMRQYMMEGFNFLRNSYIDALTHAVNLRLRIKDDGILLWMM